MRFFDRPPSPTWEAVRLPGAADRFVWAWWRPPQMPHGVAVQIPPETFAAGSAPTLSGLLAALGIETSETQCVSLYGRPFDISQCGAGSLEAALPLPPSGADPTIAVFVRAQFPPVPIMPQVAEAGPAGLARIAADWQASCQIENQLDLARKQLCDMQSRLNALNRDLTPEERLHGDRQDRSDWQDARRWLREAAARVSKLIKDHDLGTASSAGRRNWFETMYTQYAATGLPFEGIEQVQRDFEMHRKTLQTLLIHMSAAQASAHQDAERRAQQVLARIAAKVRAARVKH